MAQPTRPSEVDSQDSPPSLAPTLAASSTDDNQALPSDSKKSGFDTPPPEQAPGVDVGRAEGEFEELRRQLSRASSLHRVQTGQKDPEKEGADADDFDLLDYLKGSRAARDAHGFKAKEVGVAWDDLTVIGGGGLKINIRTFPDAVMEQFMMPVLSVLGLFGIHPFAPKPKTILEGFDGLLLPGEMCLVVGRPGSGCSSFLMSIAGQRETFLETKGDVRYAGIDAETMRKKYPGEVVYNQEDDVHLPTLTVGQTLDFALSTKTPGKRLPGTSTSEFREQVLDTTLKMLNISHTKNTVVGNQFVRGVSGGERKRVSIAEMMAARACVASWDNSTRGLDASTALDYAKSLRILTDVFKQTTFVSLYQAGEGIYNQFDKVLVIDDGRQVYFGPANEARQYIVSLGYLDKPRQTTADFLSGATDENEREYQPGRSAADVPSNAAEFAEAYRKSDVYRRMKADRDAYNAQMAADESTKLEFQAAVAEDKRKGVSKKSPYTVSFPMQVAALAKRQFQLKKQDKFGTYTSLFTSVAIAIICGSVYLNLPPTSSGAFTRGGCIFIAMLFNALNAFSELPTQMMGRPILFKQVNYRFFRPGALALASNVAEMPFNVPQIFLFCVIIYFMADLYRSAGAFFTFFLFVYMTFLVMTAFFRVLGVITRSYDVAARLASVLISIMVLYSGYLVPVFSMKRWLFWLYYLNPLNYGFASLMENEFSRLDFLCEGSYLVPSGAGYPTELGPNQVCNLFGAQPGQASVAGSDYIQAGFQYRTAELWRNFGILWCFFIGFAVLQVLAMEFLAHGQQPLSISVFAKENADTKKRNAALQESKERARRGEVEQDLSSMTTARQPFTWEALRYTVPVPGGTRQLLDNVYGYCKPGTLTALMGASGAGKTTLLDVLADRKTIGVIDGSLLMNGRPIGIDFQRGTAYVEQADVHEPYATVREAFRCSAYLRQPYSTPKAEKDAYVEEILQLLELEDFADALIGFPGFGLSVEARKRLTIGVELAAKPQLLLFLDEPTSGLDGQSAFNVVRFLKKLAAAGQSVLCTIHQPNAMLFESFDRLLLLQRGGQCVYFGDVGKDSHVLNAYLAKNGAPVPDDANTAEFMLEAIGAGSSKRMGGGDWHEKWKASEEFAAVKREIEALNAQAIAAPGDYANEVVKEYSTPFGFQLKTILTRTLTSYWRMADYGYTRLFSHAAVALVTSLTYLNLGSSTQDLQYRVFAIFIVTVLPAIIIAQVEPLYIMSRDTFNREASSKMYSSTVFSISQIVSELPYSILCAVVFFLLFYFPMGFNFTPSRAGFQFLVVLTAELFSVVLGQAVAALSPTILVAALFNPWLLVILSIFCGVTIPAPQLPHFWRVWMYQLDPFTRLIASMVSTELHGLEITCLESEFKVFSPPSGQTCIEYAASYLETAGGYLNNESATADCQYCPYAVGDEFYTPLGISYDNRWRDWGILVAFTAFNVIVALVASRFLRYAKR